MRDARNTGLDDIAPFFGDVMEEDSRRAQRCHELLARLSGTAQAGPGAS